MTKPSNPFLDMDFTKMMSEMDFTKMMSEMKLPGVDMTAVTAAQTKNVEAVIAANQRAIEGFQTLAQRQAQILQESMGELTQAMTALTSDTSPDVKAQKQMELAQEAMGKALSDMREIAEIMTESTNETFEVINKRVTESIDEARKILSKAS